MEKLTCTVQEASEALGLHHLTVRRAIDRGELPAVRVGRRILIPRKALEAFLESKLAARAG